MRCSYMILLIYKYPRSHALNELNGTLVRNEYWQYVFYYFNYCFASETFVWLPIVLMQWRQPVDHGIVTFPNHI